MKSMESSATTWQSFNKTNLNQNSCEIFYKYLSIYLSIYLYTYR